MGQVWSKADFDGTTGNGNDGGRGSILAVTAQNPGADGVWDTPDDVVSPMNVEPLEISIDESGNSSTDTQNPLDRVRNFYSFHPAGANFAFGDGSIQYLTETIDVATYRHLSTMAGREVVAPY